MGIFNGAGSRPGWEEKDAADFRRELIEAASAGASIGLGQQFKHGDKVVNATIAGAGGDGQAITTADLMKKIVAAKKRIDAAGQSTLDQSILEAGKAFLAEQHPGESFHVFIDNNLDNLTKRLCYKRVDGLELSDGHRVGQIMKWPSYEKGSEIAARFEELLREYKAHESDGLDDNPLTAYEGGGDW